MNLSGWQYIIFFLMSFILGLILTPIIRLVAIKYGLVAYPREDRWHQHPTAILGGVSIYLASVIPVIFLPNITGRNVLGLFLGATFLFFMGLLDDKFHFTPYSKLFMQIIATSMAIYFGNLIGLPVDTVLVIPLTFLWIIGITNSFNLLDNIDGLATGIAAISSLMLFFSTLIFSNNSLGIFALILAGSTLGFLPYNFNPARIFMGDSGSMFLGYSLAVISIAGTSRHISNLLVTMFIPVLILSVPIFDTIFVMIGRKFQGRKIFEGGKDHISHRLVTLGMSQRKTVLLLYGISIIFGLIAFLYSRLNMFVISVVAFLAIVILLFLGMFIFEVATYNDYVKLIREKNKLKDSKTILNNILLYKRRIVEVLLDFIFICVAYYSAYFLRFEGSPLFASNMQLIKESLFWIILIKTSVFYIFGLYRGIWKYMGISDLLTIFKVVSLSSIASVLFLTFAFRFSDYSRVVFFMDWLILLFLISGSRILFRIIGEFFSRIREKGTNVLIFGAGDTGEMVLREIKRNRLLNYNPIGFIDDDPSKIGNKIHGISVLGAREEIKSLAKVYNIKELLIAVSSIDIDNFLEIVNICKNSDIAYRKIKGILDKEEVVEFGKS